MHHASNPSALATAADRSPTASGRQGTILVMVLVILGATVMLASAFVGLMATQRSTGTRQTGRQLATQVTEAAMAYALQAMATDYANSRNDDVPQRYLDIYNLAGTNLIPNADGRGDPESFVGMLPTTAAGLSGVNWKLPFEGGISSNYFTTLSSGTQKLVSQSDNQFNNGANADVNRRVSVDSMTLDTQAVPLMYANFYKDWFYDDGSSQTFDRFDDFIYYYPSHKGRPRWFTQGYYDKNFQPLALSDGDTAAYEARFSVMPIPIDGTINLDFGERILASNNKGRFRFGDRADSGAVSSGVAASAAATAASWYFAPDQIKDEDRNPATYVKLYPNPSSVTIDVSASFPYTFYKVDPITDTCWNTPIGTFPLAQQYGTALGNMIGIFGISDNSVSITIKKTANLVWDGDTTPPSVPANPRALYHYDYEASYPSVASKNTGRLSQIMNIAMGQGFLGGLANYSATSRAGIGDAWSSPSIPAFMQVGTPVSWRQFHGNLGYGGGTWNDSVVSNNRLLPIMCFAFSPFGIGLNATDAIVPDRNFKRANSAPADIDCPWYVNIMTVTRDAAHAMIAGMDATYFANFDNRNGNQGDSSSYPTNRNNLLPIPPDKTDPGRAGAAYAASWDDGVAKTGADGVEGGAIPPLNVGTTHVMATGYKRPPANSSEFNPPTAASLLYMNDTFAGNGPLYWKNPVRDELLFMVNAATPVLPVLEPVVSYVSAPYTASNGGFFCFDNIAYACRMMTGGKPQCYASAYQSGWNSSGEDKEHLLAIGGSYAQSISYENYPKNAETELDQNIDPVDERLSYQDDIIAAMVKTLVDCHYDRLHGKKINKGTAYGYKKIEEVEMVFLAYLGISVCYDPDAPSLASTTGATASNYKVWPVGAPPVAVLAPEAINPANVPTDYPDYWPLGKMNQLHAMANGPNAHQEIGADRSDGVTLVSLNMTNKDGRPGQKGYRNYTALKVTPVEKRDAGGNPTGVWTCAAGWPNRRDGSAYSPTWAALSRILEHRLNDYRMSIFGTPALDLNRDGIVDATTMNGSGMVSAADPQMHFSVTGRFFLGRIHTWRMFTKTEIWDRRANKIVAEAALERALMMDPNGDGDLSDTHAIFSRWHRTPILEGKSGPTPLGRTVLTP